ncbi:hypothetical protein [Bradyrhizobium embrapense]|uniref:hypothetical protein n=1 Tax=Bradyrhizobium embrapense TaxID=630921 RepID=UPI00067DCF69|nr:hypothetical protein [Bradyrhizobium embrapense]
MATDEQKTASKHVMDAVTALNNALTDAGALGIFVELRQYGTIGGRNGGYLVEKIEIRETVLPA